GHPPHPPPTQIFYVIPQPSQHKCQSQQADKNSQHQANTKKKNNKTPPPHKKIKAKHKSTPNQKKKYKKK
ncbi:hypothetical protein ACI4A9_28770, partial [Klebsiella pneumoniae]|uniref:hypothetical protein n=1 Tax=Klebsiella pneumoniae TaxID=573 RepID=UPI0038534DC9